jgi:hypothetical protein
MSDLRIITNNVPRDIIDAYELGADEQSEFDYLDWEAIKDGRDSASFFRYKGELHDLGEFLTTSELSRGAGHHDLSAWDGYQSDSFFSGLVVRYVDNFERVIIGTYLA